MPISGKVGAGQETATPKGTPNSDRFESETAHHHPSQPALTEDETDPGRAPPPRPDPAKPGGESGMASG